MVVYHGSYFLTDRNIAVLTTPTGALCVCNQVPYERREAKEEPFKLTYEVILYHHGQLLPSSTVNAKILAFQMDLVRKFRVM